MCLQNHQASQMQCESILREVFDTLEKGISYGLYLKPGGYRQYRDMLAQLAEEYRARTRSQIMVQNTHALLAFYCSGWPQQHETALINIRNADKD